MVFLVSFDPAIDDHGSLLICRVDSVRPKHLCDQNFDHDYYCKLFRERDAQSSGRRLYFHAMSASELSRVRTELDQLRIIPTIPPHPVQPNREFPGHRRLGNVLMSSHRQVHIATPPVRVTPGRRLRCFSPQVAQQRVALLAEMSQPLPPGTGVFTRNKPRIAADLLATREPAPARVWRIRCSSGQGH